MRDEFLVLGVVTMSCRQNGIRGMNGTGAVALLAGVAATVVGLFSGHAKAASINIQFGTDSANGGTATASYIGTAMDSADSGTVWNQDFFAANKTAGGTNYGGASGTDSSLVYSDGSTASGISVTVNIGTPSFYTSSSAGQDGTVPAYMQGYGWNSPQYDSNAAQTVQISGLTNGASYKIYLYSSGPYNEAGTLFQLAAANTPAGAGSYMLIDPKVNGADVGDPNFNTNANAGSGNYTAFTSGAAVTAAAPTADPTTNSALSNWGVFNTVAAVGAINISYNVPSYDPNTNWVFLNAIQIQPVSTPEPATFGLFAIVLGSVMLLSRKRSAFKPAN